eukprot:3795568-Alexandrium_andersonii.AAC.1
MQLLARPRRPSYSRELSPAKRASRAVPPLVLQMSRALRTALQDHLEGLCSCEPAHHAPRARA